MAKNLTALENLATECARLRYQGNPGEAIKLTDDVIHNLDKYESQGGLDRIYCTRGAAFRQIGNNEEALKCAFISLEINSEFRYAYNLAGAATIGLGNLQKAEVLFEEARKRGVNASHIEKLKRLAIDREVKTTAISRSSVIKQSKHIYAFEEYGFEPKDLYGHAYSAYEERFYQDEMYKETDSFSEMWERSNDDGWFYGDE